MALVPYVAAAVPTEEEELIGRLSSALLAWLPEDNGLPLIELDYSDEQAIEKVTLACVERYFGLLVEFVNITRSAEPIDPRVLAGTFFHADKLCRFQLTAAHGERASRRVTSEEAEKLHMIWRYAYRQYLRTPDSSRSAKLMRLKATMFRYELFVTGLQSILTDCRGDLSPPRRGLLRLQPRHRGHRVPTALRRSSQQQASIAG